MVIPESPESSLPIKPRAWYRWQRSWNFSDIEYLISLAGGAVDLESPFG